jgi:hypothetical protein
MTLSLPLRKIAALLRMDGAQENGCGVLFASTLGFDEFERNVDDVAAVSGDPASRDRDRAGPGAPARSSTSCSSRVRMLRERSGRQGVRRRSR